MVLEAPLETVENVLALSGEGWFVLDARDAQWYASELAYARFGEDVPVACPDEFPG